jgi:hypothetical protein
LVFQQIEPSVHLDFGASARAPQQVFFAVLERTIRGEEEQLSLKVFLGLQKGVVLGPNTG